MPPLMLCIHMSKERALRLSLAALALGVQTQQVETDQEGQTLSALCGLEAPQTHPPAVQVGEEMLLFAFLPEALLDRLLSALRGGDLPRVRLKAVLTPNNRSWRCDQLYAELNREAAAFAAQGRSTP